MNGLLGGRGRQRHPIRGTSTMRYRSHSGRIRRRGAAALEMAILLPVMMFLFVAGTDYARIFSYLTVITNCASNGAAYAARSPYDAASPYANLTAAALADASGVSPQPTVSSASGTDADGNKYVEV